MTTIHQSCHLTGAVTSLKINQIIRCTFFAHIHRGVYPVNVSDVTWAKGTGNIWNVHRIHFLMFTGKNVQQLCYTTASPETCDYLTKIKLYDILFRYFFTPSEAPNDRCMFWHTVSKWHHLLKTQSCQFHRGSARSVLIGSFKLMCSVMGVQHLLHWN